MSKESKSMLISGSYNTSNISYRGRTKDLIMARKYASPRLMLSRAVIQDKTPKTIQKIGIKNCIAYFKRQLSGNKKISGE